ncbi:MAG: HAMP domain-containing histidine kinase [Gammaproteobacteria bacterium]|nr:HAMP domain-containing histidine kinase [Gammaproteobacteria bacterium]
MSKEANHSGLRSLFAPLYWADSTSTTRQALLLLLLIRSFVTVLGGVGLFIYQSYSGNTVPATPMIAVFAGIFISIMLGLWRLKKVVIISNRELLANLMVDALFLVLVLFTVGGASNPLISYLLVLLAVGATFLTQLQANLFALGSILIYSLFIFVDLRTDNNGSDSLMTFQLHLVGMWAIFVVSAILISVFVTRMANTIRERELTLAQSRENEMRNEQLVAIGTLAAGTAHALGTPLSTMSVLLTDLDNLSAEEVGSIEVKEDISILRQQVIRCKNSLSQLTNYYNKEYDNSDSTTTLQEFVESLKDYITNIHPSATISFTIGDRIENAKVPHDPNINHAVINIIENGIKAAQSKTMVVFNIPKNEKNLLEISVQDDGPGMPNEVMEKMGEPFISTREGSMGLGIYLANATIQKAGGGIEMFNLKTGGAVTVIRLPTKDTT